jgi:hypothetical protein
MNQAVFHEVDTVPEAPRVPAPPDLPPAPPKPEPDPDPDHERRDGDK